MKSKVLIYRIGGWLVIAGLLLAIFGLGQVLWVTFVEANEGMAEAVREFVLSLRPMLLVLTIAWAHRTLEIFRALNGKVSLRQSRIARSAALSRIQAWLSFMFAWGSTSLATIHLLDMSTTAAVIFCALVFGGAMWLLERRVAQMALLN